MKSLVVGIGECLAAKDADAALVTFALGSCVGVAVFDPVAAVGEIGRAHV